jgi:16S rRNA (guanine527-N7)-methyltransferase
MADSLSGLEVEGLRGARRIGDVGAGAGFPGLVLAIALPEAGVDLIESRRRKCDVIDRLALAVGIQNARTIPLRAEEWALGEGREAYEAVTARALAPLAVLVEYAAPLLAVGGALVAWKGARNSSEEQAGERAARELGLASVEVRRVQPFEAAEQRHLHVYEKVSATPPRFPRRPGVARRRPLG